jgi:hypothetical protein
LRVGELGRTQTDSVIRRFGPQGMDVAPVVSNAIVTPVGQDIKI